MRASVVVEREVFNHPAYSPDLVPSDYNLFQHLKRFLAGQHLSSNDDVQTAGSYVE
ncbi:hypothetical protein AVEN_161619-1, partial [Araneus ventricosus]